MLRQAEYLERLKKAIFVHHKCHPSHRETAFVHVKTKDAETVWSGHVEVFDLDGHHEADICYAWHNVENDGKVFAVLGNNFIDSPKRAVEVAIFTDKERPLTSSK
jgi:hypothetical protein